MLISIKSEMDSRILLYPLMRSLMHFGSILVVSKNPFLKRLIDDTEFSTFRNMSILVNNEGAIDEVYRTYGIKSDDYDFIITDNMGVSEYDALFLLFGNGCSQLYMEDKEAMEQGEDINKIFFIDFSTKTEKKQSRVGKPEAKGMEEFDPTEKYRRILGEEKRKEVRTFKGKFPTYAEIEQVEGEHLFYQVDDSLIKAFYEAFGAILGVAEDNFRKELRLKDEGSNSI